MVKLLLKMKSLFLTVILACAAIPHQAFSSPRFFLSGDGTLVMNGRTIPFRDGQGAYDEAGLKKINGIFGTRWDDSDERLDLRFVEILDYVQDQLKGGSYFLKSGYRSPRLNQSLRDRGQLAAQSSMHIEGAAGDLKLAGVDPSKVFDFVKDLDCCGIGYYHGGYFHLDSGPSRYWDEKTSKTEDKTPQENEKIILQADYDRYGPEEEVGLKFMRVTNYPIGVPRIVRLVPFGASEKGVEWRWDFARPQGDPSECLILHDRKAARTMHARLPVGLKAGRYSVQVKFCNRYDYTKMPEEIVSRPFEVGSPMNHQTSR